MYLEPSDIAALSGAIKRAEVAWWMTDFSFPGLKKRINRNVAGLSENAPFKFAPENGLAFFEDLGWRVIEAESLLKAARRLHRLPMDAPTELAAIGSAPSGRYAYDRGRPAHPLTR